ncbi:hypothetical protein Hanom_Chr02g00160431 [Helianthus anomalus]
MKANKLKKVKKRGGGGGVLQYFHVAAEVPEFSQVHQQHCLYSGGVLDLRLSKNLLILRILLVHPGTFDSIHQEELFLEVFCLHNALWPMLENY